MRNRVWGAPMWVAGTPTHRASYRRSARSPSTAPSARRGRAGASPRCHGSGSRPRTVAPCPVAPCSVLGVAVVGLRASSGSPCGSWRTAGADSSPRTFSAITHSGCSASIACAICAHSPERVPGAGCQAGAFADRRDVLTGEPSAQHVDRRGAAPVDGGDVAQVGDAGPVVGEDAGHGRVELGEPHGAGVEDLLHREVEPAVAGEQRPDPQTRTSVGGVVGSGFGHTAS